MGAIITAEDFKVTELKLNLGARDTVIPGFINVDCDPHNNVRVAWDVSKLHEKDCVAPNSVSEIYASHILEHFPHRETLNVLKSWCHILKPNGILYVAVPDFHRVVELYLQVGINDWLQEYVNGGQEYATAYHYAIFNENKLRSLLLEAGFSEASRVDLFPVHAPNDCSIKCSDWDNKPISLNMVAVR